MDGVHSTPSIPRGHVSTPLSSARTRLDQHELNGCLWGHSPPHTVDRPGYNRPTSSNPSTKTSYIPYTRSSRWTSSRLRDHWSPYLSLYPTRPNRTPPSSNRPRDTQNRTLTTPRTVVPISDWVNGSRTPGRPRRSQVGSATEPGPVEGRRRLRWLRTGRCGRSPVSRCRLRRGAFRLGPLPRQSCPVLSEGPCLRVPGPVLPPFRHTRFLHSVSLESVHFTLVQKTRTGYVRREHSRDVRGLPRFHRSNQKKVKRPRAGLVPERE